MFWDIIIIVGIVWIIMSFFSYMQAVHIRNIYKALEPCGAVYFGKDAGLFRTRYFVFASVDAKGTIADAKKLKASRLITFPKTLPMAELVGEDLHHLSPENFTEDIRIQMSLANLKKNYVKYKAKGK